MSFDINKEQRKASNPLSSCWVSASAGSGKTKVLIDRVLRLLLQYGAPDKILCLTFTKTAAANMASKINQILKKWAIMPEERLIKILTNLLGEEPEPETVQRAQCLFASLLDEAQPIKMMTIHSFCQSVLKRFPLEAGISPNFEVIDEQKTKEILAKCLKTAQENPSFKEEIATLSDATYEKGLMELFEEVLSKRTFLQEVVSENNSLQDLSEKLKEYLHISSFNSKEEVILSEFSSIDEFEEKKITCLTQKFKIRDNHKDDPEAFKVQKTLHNLNNWTVWHQTVALLRISLAILTEYEAIKKADCLLDYDDLISVTKNLLEKNDMASWVLFKLDGGIDHILVDEAQDTNFQQWSIIKMLTEEFFAGMGRSEKIRTIFAVGDKKQSIFSFQGAEPDAFEEMHHLFEQRVIDSENDFETVPLNLSFRSTKPILDLVNFLLKNKRATNGILWPEDTEVTHLTWRKGVAGKVEIWPLIKTEKKQKAELWNPGVEYDTTISSDTRLAKKIALKISSMISQKEILPSENRPIQAGDFLILFQRRSTLMLETVRALKEANVPVVGIDRLKLTTHIAIEDLMSLADFCLLPSDDLSLACVLKSPLFNLSEKELFQLAAYRDETPLKERLKEDYSDIYSFLNQLIQLATYASPFSFFTEILSTYKGRQKFKERLGQEVEETLDEFLNLILTFQQSHPRSLSVFMHWLKNQGNDIEIKRDLEQDDINAVHIMTVHASKGLQGKIVFLPDTLFVPQKMPRFIQTPIGLPLWLSKSDLKTPLTESFFGSLKEKKLQEYRRLLYVALTRASDMLFICGAEGGRKANKENWYDLIVESVPYAPNPEGIISIESPQTEEVQPSDFFSAKTDEITLPDWAMQKAPQEPTPFKPLKPSHVLQKNTIATSPLQEANEKSLQFGTFIHQLLAYLPTVSPEKRKEIALSLKPKGMDIPQNIFTLLENEKFAFLFKKNSLAEVPVMGIVDNQVVSGQIDRLVIEENQVLIIDYKTNSVVPSITDVPQNYKSQLSYYKCLISDIFPDKIVKTYLLWTKTLELMEIK